MRKTIQNQFLLLTLPFFFLLHPTHVTGVDITTMSCEGQIMGYFGFALFD